MITIYSSHTCPYCDKLERYFDSIDLAYDILYIDDDRKALRELVELTGIAGVPVTVFEDNDFIVGYDRENIDKKLSEIEKSADIADNTADNAPDNAEILQPEPARYKPTKVKVVRAQARPA
jgi:glutaredoxin